MTETDPRARLRSLERAEEAIRNLREQESDLEVEHMAAEAALHSATARRDPGIDPARARRIGRVLERRDALERRARSL